MARLWQSRGKLFSARFCEELASSQYARYIPIILLGLLAYSNTFFSPFVLDDVPNITANPMVTDFSMSALRDAFTTRRGVGILTFQLNYLVSKDSVTGYHVVNLLIHLANSLLVLHLLQIMLKILGEETVKGKSDQLSPMLPFFAALFFAVHPLQTQAVTYIVQRFASLATFFYLSAMFAYLLARVEQLRTGRILSARALFPLGMTVLFAFLAINTKETAYTLPAAIVMTELLLFGGARRKLCWLGAMGASLLAIMLFKVGSHGTALLSAMNDATRVQSIASRTDYLFTQFRVIVTYLRLIVFPVNQRVEYDYPLLKSFFDWRVITSFILLAALFALAGYFLKTASGNSSQYRRLAAFGIIWFFLTLSVESSIIPIIDLLFEHRVYLPMFGALTSILAVIAIVAEKRGAGGVNLCRPLFVVSIVLAVATFARNSVWKSEVLVWSDSVAKSPLSARAWNNLGGALIKNKEGERALRAIIRSIELDPSKADAWNNLGIAIDLMGVYNDRFRRTTEMFRAPGAVDSKSLNIWLGDVNNNLGLAYEILGDLRKAVESYRNAVGYYPSLGLAYYNLGILSAKINDPSGYSVQLQILRMVDPALAERLQSRVEQR